MVQIDRNRLTQQWIAENAGEISKVRRASRTKARQIQKSTDYTKPKPRSVQCDRERELRKLITKPIVAAQPDGTGTRYSPVTAEQQANPAYTDAAGPVQPNMPAPPQPQPGPPPHHLPQKLKGIARRQYEDKRKRDWHSVRERSRASTRARQHNAKAEVAETRRTREREARAEREKNRGAGGRHGVKGGPNARVNVSVQNETFAAGQSTTDTVPIPQISDVLARHERKRSATRPDRAVSTQPKVACTTSIIVLPRRTV